MNGLKVVALEVTGAVGIIVGLGGVAGVLVGGWELLNNELDFHHAKKKGWV